MADKTRPSPRSTDTSTLIPKSTESIGATDMNAETEPKSQGKRTSASSKATLPAEIIELVQELRDTVRRIDPKRHTPNSLRRSLVNVTSILEDIQAASSPKSDQESSAAEK